MKKMGKLFRRNFGNTKISPNYIKPTEYNHIGNSYISHGYRVKRGSKLDNAIKNYHKKGYYSTDITGPEYGPNQNFRKDPPTLRPALSGGTFHTKHYHHPLASKEETFREGVL